MNSDRLLTEGNAFLFFPDLWPTLLFYPLRITLDNMNRVTENWQSLAAMQIKPCNEKHWTTLIDGVQRSSCEDVNCSATFGNVFELFYLNICMVTAALWPHPILYTSLRVFFFPQKQRCLILCPVLTVWVTLKSNSCQQVMFSKYQASASDRKNYSGHRHSALLLCNLLRKNWFNLPWLKLKYYFKRLRN